MSDVKVKRVVVVKKARPTVHLVQWESDKVIGKKARRTRATAIRAEGRDFFSFCWNVEKFRLFADRCVESGMRPNDVVWQMIEKEMGWKE